MTARRTATLAALAAASLAAGWALAQVTRAPAVVNPRPVTDRGPLNDVEAARIELFREAAPSVVNVTTVQDVRNRRTNEVFEVERGSGTGFIWDNDGHIVTNFHVLQGGLVHRGATVIIQLDDHSRWEAEVVGIAPTKDLAVVRIDAPASLLDPIELGTSGDLDVGQDVLAIGNPFGLDHSLTTGVVSALGRTIESLSGTTIYDVIQTDAAINPGNSGGPLLDSSGRLVGVSTQIRSPSGASAGIGFAVPADTVNHIVPQLIARGEVTAPRMGIYQVPPHIARRLGVRHGVLIHELEAGGPAERSGLRGSERSGRDLVPGDLIVEVDGRPIDNFDELLSVLQDYTPGDEVEVTIIRGGEQLDLTVRLGEPPRETR